MTTKSKKILIVDDEAEIRNMLNIFLGVEDFEVVEADCGKAALREAVAAKPDLIVLDLGLPDMDGQDIIKAIRQFSHVPIIVLTARHDDQQTVSALNAGAEDYITKPFRAEVLLARINANLRQHTSKSGESDLLFNGPIRMDLTRHEVFISDELTAFTPKEFELLKIFVIKRGKMLTHKHILREVWGSNHTDDTQYLRVYIGQVRAKLAELASSITSESGIGYRMENLTSGALDGPSSDVVAD